MPRTLMTSLARSQRLRLCPLAAAFWTLTGLVTVSANLAAQEAQDEEEAPSAAAPAKDAAADQLLPRVAARAASVTKPDVDALAEVLEIGKAPRAGSNLPPSTLTSLGDLDGDGVPEMVLIQPLQDPDEEDGAEPGPELRPQWSTYLLSWNGTKWQASSLAAEIGDSTVRAISLGSQASSGIALVTREGNPTTAWPSIFRVRDHAAELVWDSQSDDSRYTPLLGGRVEFQFHESAATELIVTGRADPGLLQFDPTGRRGFDARAVYHWDGKAYVLSETAYTPGQDYTLYRFIAALHLRDFRSAYALIVPGSFLETDKPSLDGFTKFCRDTRPEFVGDSVFRALEPRPGAADGAVFELSLPEKHYLYHPTFSSDGKYLITGLKRTQEAAPAETP